MGPSCFGAFHVKQQAPREEESDHRGPLSVKRVRLTEMAKEGFEAHQEKDVESRGEDQEI